MAPLLPRARRACGTYPLLPPAAIRAVVPSPVRVRRARGARASTVAPVRAIVTSAVTIDLFTVHVGHRLAQPYNDGFVDADSR